MHLELVCFTLSAALKTADCEHPVCGGEERHRPPTHRFRGQSHDRLVWRDCAESKTAGKPVWAALNAYHQHHTNVRPGAASATPCNIAGELHRR